MNIDTITSIVLACRFFLGKYCSRSFADLNIHIFCMFNSIVHDASMKFYNLNILISKYLDIYNQNDSIIAYMFNAQPKQPQSRTA